ncbi:MAG: hypothetical protein L0I76_24335 [Pseudonocardia sp.]|nr:hypothetical protein [Pseudonocardia sp.]
MISVSPPPTAALRLTVALVSVCAFALVLLVTSPPAHAADYWTVMVRATDERGQYMPVRNGDAGFGYTKACQKHNFCNLNLIQATIEGRGDTSDEGGGRFKYTGHVVGDEVGDVTLIVIGDLNPQTARGATPDGGPAGVITAYCAGAPRCPDPINA